MAIIHLIVFSLVAAPLNYLASGLAIVAWTTTPRPTTTTLGVTTALALGVALGSLVIGVRLILRVAGRGRAPATST